MSQAWHAFIDTEHQEAVYSSTTTDRPLPSMSNPPTFSKVYDKVTSSKESCKCHFLITRNWEHPEPLTREAVIEGDFPGAGSAQIFQPFVPYTRERLQPFSVLPRPLPKTSRVTDDGPTSWFGCLLKGEMLLGYARTGEALLCSNWRSALQNPATALRDDCLVIETSRSYFDVDLGGWLAASNHRNMFETHLRIHGLGLTDDDKFPSPSVNLDRRDNENDGPS
ncbi:hypothetical protein LTR62_005792 [Meristemomyces frigidus]|uniref:Uncharacterized protein n=1 Tax=Meristemomyces frigidus TaxID=1508187 RepID=A0AAN7YIX9_9PEZI|nr:hypothetical protein LTR62_005792 [Meristemomyces frigidus]